MNGAHALLHTLVGADVTVCFANPGTSEMHFVAATDDVPEMRSILGLFEGVVTGAADGYARMTDRPAATLLHLGPGMANGIANLHNARRANVPLVNIVGDHATYHKQYDAPLDSDIEAAARTFSGWVDCPMRAEDVGNSAAAAVTAACGPPPMIATLILPADVSWNAGASPATPLPKPAAVGPDDQAVANAAKVLGSSEPCLLLLGGRALRVAALRHARRIADATGAGLLSETFPTRVERGAGRPEIDRLLYDVDAARAQLADYRHVILVEAASPVSFFAYPGVASPLVPEGCQVHVLTSHGHDSASALAELADRTATDREARVAPLNRPTLPTGPLSQAAVADAVGALLPEGAVVVDESGSAAGSVPAATVGAPPHDWLKITGGAIGWGLPAAVGAAVAVPDRKVISLQADGSAMYTIQSLWTAAREQLDITVVIFNNRSYGILRGELRRLGTTPGRQALDILDLSRPDIDFVSLANGLGVEAERATTANEFIDALRRGLGDPRPRLIDAIL
jgi:acetolactate synthase I/II/III large subunit